MKDLYDKIIKNMKKYPNGIPMKDGKVSPSFREFVELLFTPEEVEIVQYLTVKPQSLTEVDCVQIDAHLKRLALKIKKLR